MSDTQNEDFTIKPVNMAQSMSIAAMMVHSLIASAFIKPDDTEEEKVTATYVSLAVFFHAFCCSAKHKDKMIGILKIIIAELEFRRNEESKS
jgi:hypothetical protein